MSRSTYVYVVQIGRIVVAAFTVKYELIAYLRGTGMKAHMLTVNRLPDGAPHGRFPVPLDVKELLA